MLKLLILAQPFEKLIHAIGSTLVHSLWQGLIVVILTGVVMMATKNSKPLIRYNFLVLLLASFALTTLFTFVGAFRPIAEQVAAPTTVNAYVPLFEKPVSVLMATVNYLSGFSQTLVFVWILFVTLRCLKLVDDFRNLRRLRASAQLELGEVWLAKTREIAKALHIRPIVQLAESSLVKIPMVIGHLKPLIVLPIGLLTALPPKEIEAILIHEMAHIHRRDYLINVFQSVIEVLFFFNPAILWLSTLIRTERENCCDDIVIEKTGNKLSYLNALLSCQEYQQTVSAFAMTFNKRNQLKMRVQRMVYNHNRSLSLVEKSFMILSAVCIGFYILPFSNSVPDEVASISSPVLQKAQKLAPQPTAKKADPKIGKLKVSHATITASPIRAEKPIQAELPKCDTLQTGPLKTPLPALTAALNPIQQINPVAPVEKVAPVARVAPANENGRLMLADQVALELVKDNLIARIDDQLSFKLSNAELIVNGKKQPVEIYHKYKAKYVPPRGHNTWILYYNYTVDTRTSTG